MTLKHLYIYMKFKNLIINLWLINIIIKRNINIFQLKEELYSYSNEEGKLNYFSIKKWKKVYVKWITLKNIIDNYLHQFFYQKKLILLVYLMKIF